jgi:hypothetical protein
VTQKEVADQVNSMNVFYEQHKAFRVRVSSLPLSFLRRTPIHPPHTHNTQTKIEHREKLNQQNKTASNANGVKVTPAFLIERGEAALSQLMFVLYAAYRLVRRWTSSTSS